MPPLPPSCRARRFMLSREGIESQLGIGVARVYRVLKAALWRPINDDNGGRPLLSQS